MEGKGTEKKGKGKGRGGEGKGRREGPVKSVKPRARKVAYIACIRQS